MNYDCPINVYYRNAENLSTERINEAGYDPLFVSMRTHANSKFGISLRGGCLAKQTKTLIPPEFISNPKPDYFTFYDKSAWGFDEKKFSLGEGAKLEDIWFFVNERIQEQINWHLEFINEIQKELKRMKEAKRKSKRKNIVFDYLNFIYGGEFNLKPFTVYTGELGLLQRSTGKVCYWQRGDVAKKPTVKALQLIAVADSIGSEPRTMHQETNPLKAQDLLDASEGFREEFCDMKIGVATFARATCLATSAKEYMKLCKC